MSGNAGISDDRVLIGHPVLLIIDMQHDFMNPESPNYNIGAEHTIAPTASLIGAFRSRELPVVFTREVHRAGQVDAGLEADPDYGVSEHTVEGTVGCEIIEELTPTSGEFIIDKRRYNCFLGTELDLVLRALNVTTIVICGVSSDICVHWTAGEAFQRDFHVRVVEDCTAGMSESDHEASLIILRNLCSGGRAITSDDIFSALRD